MRMRVIDILTNCHHNKLYPHLHILLTQNHILRKSFYNPLLRQSANHQLFEECLAVHNQRNELNPSRMMTQNPKPFG
jgi:hypothetical protein